MNELEELSVVCSWCTREVISFAQPPAMVEVWTNAWQKRLDRICLDCFAELLALQARLRDEAVAVRAGG